MGIDSRVSRTRQIEKINRKKLKLKLKLQKEVKLVSSSRKKQLRQYTVYAAKNTQHLKCDCDYSVTTVYFRQQFYSRSCELPTSAFLIIQITYRSSKWKKIKVRVQFLQLA